MKYGAAIIGCGKIGSEYADDPKIKDIYTHAGAYHSCPDTNLVAVCDFDAQKAKKCGNRWGITAIYTDFHKMIYEAQPAIVSICTPDPTHYQIIRDVMEYDCIRAIFAEKPLALDLDEALEIIRIAKEKNIIIVVDYFRRYSHNHRNLKNFLRDEIGIGDIQTVNGYYTKGILHNGTHWLDIARFFMGEIKSVQGFYGFDMSENDPTLNAYLIFKDGVSGYLHGCDAGMFDVFEIDIMGTRGRVRVLDSGQTIEKYCIYDDPNYSGYQALNLIDRCTAGLSDSLLHAVEDIVKCLSVGGIPLCSGSDGVEALRIGLAIRESAMTGEKITLF